MVQHLTFVNPETGYFVARVDIPGKGDRTVTGNAPVINIGEELTASGTWSSSTWGVQFKAVSVSLGLPTMADGMEKFLAHSVDGVGKGFARKLMAEFGDKVFDVIEHDPARLGKVKGVGPKRAAALVASYHEKRETRDIMVFLHGIGMSSGRAVKVYKQYGDKAIASIKENPYILCDSVLGIWGVGFVMADKAAAKLGVAANSEYRARAGVHHVLSLAVGQGSCGLPVAVVLERASELLGVDYTLLERAIELELLGEKLVKAEASGQVCLFPNRVYYAEEALATAIVELVNRVPARPIRDLEQRILEAELDLGIELAESQRAAARVALSSNICVMTGGPGTGKTTITKLILKVLEDSTDVSVGGHGVKPIIVLAAPTGKAAKRASEATGRPASTVHRVLEVDKDGTFKHNAKNRLEGDIFGADEFSMADVFLANSYLQAIPSYGRVLIVGDVDQLPSVGPGKVLKDLIDSGVLPVVRLTEVFRQAATSDIIKNAHAINEGRMPRLGYHPGSDFCFNIIEAKDPNDEDEKRAKRAEIALEIVRVCKESYRLGYDPVRDVQVLCPMRKGPLGIEALNTALQAALNPHPTALLEVNGVKWCTGDKVMQLRNNYDKGVFNGDVGYVIEVDTTARRFTIEFSDKTCVYTTGELDELTLAYAMTVHRSQGSEFPVVVMPLDNSHWMMLKRNLFFTGVTRARKLFVGFGTHMAVRTAVENNNEEERYSRLKEWLRNLILRAKDPARQALEAEERLQALAL